MEQEEGFLRRMFNKLCDFIFGGFSLTVDGNGDVDYVESIKSSIEGLFNKD